MHAIYDKTCPNCGGPIGDDRLVLAAPCRKCLPISDEELERIFKEKGGLSEYKRALGELLKKFGTMKEYEKIVVFEEEVEKFLDLANRILGSRLWDAQISWAKKAIRGLSFAIIAPTGVGKTTFGLLYALYLASKGRKSYIMVPTSVLVEQAAERLKQFKEKSGIWAVAICYHGGLSEKEKKEVQEAIKEGDFHILITTSQFLARKFDELKHLKFDFAFVDDVDALLKASKNIDRVLQLLGFTPEIIEEALGLIAAKRTLAYALRRRLEEELEEARREIERHYEEIERFKERNKVGMLIVSTATGRPRGMRVKLFRELLGFEVGSRAEQIRNIADLYKPIEGSLEDEVVNTVKRLGKGGLVYVPIELGSTYAGKLAEKLRDAGVKAEAFSSREKKRQLERYVNGELEVLVSVASYYGLLVRGLDLPHVIRYAVFAGVPRARFPLTVGEAPPIRVLQLLSELRDLLEDVDKRRAEKYIARLTRELDVVHRALQLTEKGVTITARYQRALTLLEEARAFLQELLRREEVLRKVEESPYISLKRIGEQLYIFIPDALTYIQASGRTSRVFAGGISKGISVVLVDDQKVFNGLMQKTRWLAEETEWKAFDEVNLDEIVAEVDRDRELIKKLISGKIFFEALDLVRSALLIVESPNKARTIANFFGRPAKRTIGSVTVYEISTGKYVLTIAASGGHIFDLVTTEGFHGVIVEDSKFIPVYSTIKRCLRCGEQFTDDFTECPSCGSDEIRDSAVQINALKKIAEEVSEILVGTDPDVEGEKIGWDISICLAPYAGKIKRVEFHEVTKKAVLNALEKPRDIDMKMVEAQIVRRIEDRWLGFELSQRLWRAFGQHSLSAGRVQTPVLGWIIEQFRKFREERKTICTVFLENGMRVAFDNLPEGVDPWEYKRRLEEAEAEIKVLGEEREILRPPPPFTTDSLLREASRLLRLNATQTMALAQDLFELGFITYHRTDSTRVSDAGIGVARTYITEKFGAEYVKPRTWMKEGAHECIRPTRPMDQDKLRELIREGVLRPVKALTAWHYRLYDLIFRRFMASQMPEAEVVKQRYAVEIPELGLRKEMEHYVEAARKGFLEMWTMPMGSRLQPGKVKVKKQPRPIIRKVPTVTLFTDGELVQMMKERGIGRPSTYAKIIDVLKKRLYVQESRRGKLVPMPRGIRVYQHLKKNYEDFVSEERTRKLEALMDAVERGEVNYQEVLRELYEEIKRLP